MDEDGRDEDGNLTKLSRARRRLVVVVSMALIAVAGAGSAVLGVCGPFADVSDAGFCPFMLEILTLGITTGTTPTTYDPGSNVSRLQMAAFLSRTVDRVLQRNGRRVVMRQFWTTQTDQVPLTATLAGAPVFVETDGADLWVGLSSGRVARVRASDARILETWTGVLDSPNGVLLAMGSVFVVAGSTTPGPNGKLYRIDPSLPAGAATTVASNLASTVQGIAFDGAKIWLTNGDGTVSIVTPGATVPWSVTTTASGYQSPLGVLYDGANIWITDTQNEGPPNATLLKLNASGGVLQTVTVGAYPFWPVFDGSNIWVPNIEDSSVSVVRASTGAVLATLTGNGLSGPYVAAFDGQRVLLTNVAGNSVSLFKAADLTHLGTSPMPALSGPRGACSDGVNFWVTLNGAFKLARY
jgi:hypothetical protein